MQKGIYKFRFLKLLFFIAAFFFKEIMSSQSHTLLLATKSPQRRQLLTDARIPFTLVAQDADETLCDYTLPFAQLLETIAIHKMNHVIMPEGNENDLCFVLTVDTMEQDSRGITYGKPQNREMAISYIQALRDYPGMVGSAFCLDKKWFNNGSWHTIERVVQFVGAGYSLDIPDHWIEIYLDNYPDYLNIAGGLTVEGYGAQFIKTISGSYGTALGLPVCEVREALEKLEFFD